MTHLGLRCSNHGCRTISPTILQRAVCCSQHRLLVYNQCVRASLSFTGITRCLPPICRTHEAPLERRDACSDTTNKGVIERHLCCRAGSQHRHFCSTQDAVLHVPWRARNEQGCVLLQAKA